MNFHYLLIEDFVCLCIACGSYSKFDGYSVEGAA